MATTFKPIASWGGAAGPSLTVDQPQSLPLQPAADAADKKVGKGLKLEVKVDANPEELAVTLKTPGKEVPLALQKGADQLWVATTDEFSDESAKAQWLLSVGDKDTTNSLAPQLSEVRLAAAEPPAPPPKPNIPLIYRPTGTLSSIPSARRTELARALLKHANLNTDVIDHHVAWHMTYKLGQQGYGQRFLFFHAAMMRSAAREIGMTPDELARFSVELNAGIPTGFGVNRSGLDQILTKAGLPTSQVSRTRYTFAGQGSPQLPYTLTGRYLDQFRDPNQLGDYIERYFHGAGHAWIGGTMAGYESPRDPIFYAWHAAVNNLLMNWFASRSGQAWLAVPQNMAAYRAAMDQHVSHGPVPPPSLDAAPAGAHVHGPAGNSDEEDLTGLMKAWRRVSDARLPEGSALAREQRAVVEEIKVALRELMGSDAKGRPLSMKQREAASDRLTGPLRQRLEALDAQLKQK